MDLRLLVKSYVAKLFKGSTKSLDTDIIELTKANNLLISPQGQGANGFEYLGHAVLPIFVSCSPWQVNSLPLHPDLHEQGDKILARWKDLHQDKAEIECFFYRIATNVQSTAGFAYLMGHCLGEELYKALEETVTEYTKEDVHLLCNADEFKQDNLECIDKIMMRYVDVTLLNTEV